MIIYKVTNTINGKIYVGQTVKSLKRRWSDHCAKSSTCLALKAAINLHGRENFTIEQIDVASNIDDLNKKEIKWIADLKSFGDLGYNLCLGGEGKSGYKQKPESVEAMRQKKMGKKLTVEHKVRISAGNTGKIMSEESKRKISQSHMGMKHSKETLAKLSKIRLGKKHSADSKAKIGLAGLGKKHSNESIKKMSENKQAIKKPVLCLNNGSIYESINEASKKLNISSGGICRSVKTGWATNGYKFQLVKGAKYEQR
jgi:group I intron endonuclease